jgi:hypothetical protein
MNDVTTAWQSEHPLQTWSNTGEGYPDFVARLRRAFADGAGQALVSREDAFGAAAEIEQL